MESAPATLIVMSAWSEQLVSRFATSLRNRRTHLGLSAQEVADRTEQLGHPVSRTAIADYELGRRKDRLMVGDALALSVALRMPLAAMLYPEQPDGEVEFYPGLSVPSHAAIAFITGDALPATDDDFTSTDDGMEKGSRWVNDWMDGSELISSAARLVRLRESYGVAEDLYMSAIERGDVAAAQQQQHIMEGLREQIGRRADEVREVGGVVNDG